MLENLYHYKTVITKIVDGDTVYAVIDLGMHIQITRKIRLAKLNAPERKYEDGLKSKEFLTELVGQHKDLVVKTTLDRSDKYGRLLGEFFTPDGVSLSKLLVDAGHATWLNK